MMLSKLQRRGLAFFLAFALTFSLVPVTGFAIEEETEPGTVETTVPETEPAVMETTVPETEPVMETTAVTEAVTEPTIETEAATEPEAVSEIEPVTETVPVDNSLAETQTDSLAEIRSEIAEYNAHYGLVPGMTDEELANVYFSVEEPEPLVLTWAAEIVAMAQSLTDSEREDFLAEENANVFFRFYDVMNRINTPAAIARTVNPLTGVSVTDTKGNGSLDGTTVTITATGEMLWGTTNEVTITNTSSMALTFSYSCSKHEKITVTSPSGTTSSEASGSFTELVPNSTVKISFTSGAWWGTATLTLSGFSLSEIKAASDVTFIFDSTLGSITVDGAAVSSGSTKAISVDGAALVATAGNGNKFLGWIKTADNSIQSATASYTLKPTSAVTLKAVFVSGTTPNACFYVGSSYLFESLTSAATFASSASTKTVILANTGTLPAGDYTIPAGVTLLIPYNDANTLCTTQPTIVTSGDLGGNYYTTPTKPTAYRTLNMGSGANITVNGALSISGSHLAGCQAAANPHGLVGFINMESGSTITIGSQNTDGTYIKGALYAWGYITGSGSVTVKSGSTVYENFQLSDWRGGDVSKSIADDSTHGVFPMSQYYVQNVEVPLKLEAGAIEYGFLSIDVTLLGVQTTTIPFVGGEKFMFNLESGYVIKDYEENSDRLKIEVHGGEVSLDSITISINAGLAGRVTIKSSTKKLPITNNMTVDIQSGTVAINQDLALFPGSKIIVGKDATCTLGSDVDIIVYDQSDWVGCTGEYNNKFMQLLHAPGRKYSRTEKDLVDATIIVNGTVDASAGAVYTTNGGANICSEGSGTISLKPGSEKTTYQYNQAASSTAAAKTYISIPIAPTKLKNGNGEYVDTSSKANTYTYIDGYWRCKDHTYVNNVCSVCGAPIGTITLYQATLSLESLVYVNVYSKITGFEGINLTENMGLLVWTGDEAYSEENFVVGNSNVSAYNGSVANKSYYVVRTGGITAKELGDERYMRVYVKVDDDNYVYSKVFEYGPKTYAVNTLKSTAATATDTLKRLAVAMLDYGAAAQVYFDYKADDLANVTDEVDLSIYRTPYADEMLVNVVSADTSLMDEGWDRQRDKCPSVVGSLILKGIITNNFSFKFTEEIMNNVDTAKLLVWNAKTYQALLDGSEKFSENNATEVIDLIKDANDGYYKAGYEKTAVKNLGDTLYVCAQVTTKDGGVHRSGIISYSGHAYLKNKLSTTDANLLDVVKTLTVYSDCAKAQFSPN